MLLLKIGYQRCIVPAEFLPLITQIIPVKSIGKVLVKAEDCEVEIAVTNEVLVTVPAAIEEAQQEEYKGKFEMYAKMYNDQVTKMATLQAELERLKKA